METCVIFPIYFHKAGKVVFSQHLVSEKAIKWKYSNFNLINRTAECKIGVIFCFLTYLAKLESVLIHHSLVQSTLLPGHIRLLVQRPRFHCLPEHTWGDDVWSFRYWYDTLPGMVHIKKETRIIRPRKLKINAWCCHIIINCQSAIKFVKRVI